MEHEGIDLETATLNELIEERAELNDFKKELEAAERSNKAEIAAVDAEIEKRLEGEALPGASGDRGSVKRYEDEVAIIEDYEKLWAYMKRKDKPELLQKRVGQRAVAELLEDPKVKKIPGIGFIIKTGIRFTPKKGK